jgi:hypothetical protein
MIPVFPCGQRVEQTDVTKVIDTFRIFRNLIIKAKVFVISFGSHVVLWKSQNKLILFNSKHHFHVKYLVTLRNRYLRHRLLEIKIFRI